MDSEYQVTSDGRTVVIRSSDAHGNFALRSIDIATDRQLHAIGDGNQYVVGLNGDWLLVTNMGNDVDGQPSELWNARTGAVVPFASYLGVAAWGVTPSGEVLRGIDIDASAQPDATADACYDLVAPIGTPTSATVPTTPTGYCGTLNVTDGMMSPDGTWAVLLVDNEQSGGNDFVAAANRRPTRGTVVAGRHHPRWRLFEAAVLGFADELHRAVHRRCRPRRLRALLGRRPCHDLGIPGTH